MEKKKLKIKENVGDLERVVDLAERRGEKFLAQSTSSYQEDVGRPKLKDHYHKYKEKFILYNDALEYAKKMAKEEKEDMTIFLGSDDRENELVTIFYNRFE